LDFKLFSILERSVEKKSTIAMFVRVVKIKYMKKKLRLFLYMFKNVTYFLNIKYFINIFIRSIMNIMLVI